MHRYLERRKEGQVKAQNNFANSDKNLCLLQNLTEASFSLLFTSDSKEAIHSLLSKVKSTLIGAVMPTPLLGLYPIIAYLSHSSFHFQIPLSLAYFYWPIHAQLSPRLKTFGDRNLEEQMLNVHGIFS